MFDLSEMLTLNNVVYGTAGVAALYVGIKMIRVVLSLLGAVKSTVKGAVSLLPKKDHRNLPTYNGSFALSVASVVGGAATIAYMAKTDPDPAGCALIAGAVPITLLGVYGTITSRVKHHAIASRKDKHIRDALEFHSSAGELARTWEKREKLVNNADSQQLTLTQKLKQAKDILEDINPNC